MIHTASHSPARRLHAPLWLAAAALLIAPFAAMQMTHEVAWDAADFAAFALLLTGLCLSVEAALTLLASPLLRFAGVVVAVIVFASVWAELAVGIFG